MELRQRIELEAKDTVGYSEAENKESFMVGLSVAFSKTEEHYEKEMENLKRQVQGYKSSYENATNDLKTLASIVNRYSEND
jgi:archaellum component FlaC